MTNNYQYLTVEKSAHGVVEVGLNRPEIHNAFDAVLIKELTSCFHQLQQDVHVRLVVLFGHGKSFSAGADLNWMRAMKAYSREENMADSQKLADMFAAMRSLNKPLIGVVQGAALGGGAGLVAVCDYVLAEKSAKIGFTETRLGIVPAVISPYVIEKIGVSYARAYFTSGMRFDGVRAYEMGLVHQVAEASEIKAAKAALIAEFLSAAPKASNHAKQLVDMVVGHAGNAKELQQKTIALIADLRVSEEGQEGMDALLTRRKPNWSSGER